MEGVKRNNPWLGLQSYQEGEVLYGRDDDIRDLTQCVINDTDTLLYGKSGIGKSSILNAGILPAARRVGYHPFIVRLDHKEHESYLSQIKATIGAETVREVIPCKDPAHESLYEYFHRHTFHDADGQRIKLLLIFDQFEEIFTLQADTARKKQFFVELADQLNDIIPTYLQNEVIQASANADSMKVVDTGDFDSMFDALDFTNDNGLPDFVQDNDIHFVFTIREDFLSEFEYFTAAIPSLKQNRYCLRPINEEQAAQIILRPVPGLISKPVAKLILEKVTGRTDFDLNDIPEIEVDSAVLSLYLNRLYNANSDAEITADLVEQKGGEIITDFYNDAISELSNDAVEYLEDKLLNGQGRRENLTIYDAIASRHITQQDISRLCNQKKILRQFLYAGELRIELVHDILCPVVKAHRELRALLKEQEEERQREQAETQQRLIRLQEEARIMRRRNRKRLTAIAVTLSAIALVLLLTWYLAYRPHHEYYANISTATGWPEGVGRQLSRSERSQFVYHYRLTRRGRLPSMTFLGMKIRHPFYKVEVLNGKGEPTTNKMIESPLVALSETENELDQASQSFALMQLRTSMWLFGADADGDISRQTAYDINGNVLYSLQYYRTGSPVAGGSPASTPSASTTQTLWANYVDAEGKSLRVRGNGADRIRITLRDSRFARMQFFNEAGAPQRNSRMAYGYLYDYDDTDNSTVSSTPLDEYGDSIAAWRLQFIAFDEFGRWTEASNSRAEYGPDHVIYTMPDRTDTLRFDEDGRQIYRSELLYGKSFRTYRYDSFGNMTSNSIYDCRNTKSLRLVRQVLCKYSDTTHELTERTDFNVQDRLRYRREVHESNDTTSIVSYFGGSSLTALKPINSDRSDYHQLITKVRKQDAGTEVQRIYRAIDEADSHGYILRQMSSYYNADSILTRSIITDSLGNRQLSLEYEIENGIVVGQHVVGLTGEPIRCPAWDDNSLCYYRKKFVRNFAGEIVAAKAVNEFGEESLITYGTREIQTSVVPGDEIQKEGPSYTIFGTGSYKLSAASVDASRQVDYLHITDTLGTYYRSGLRDGDILLSKTATEVKVARPFYKAQGGGLAPKRFLCLTFTPEEGEAGAEHYPVYYTEAEMQRLNNSIAKQ